MPKHIHREQYLQHPHELLPEVDIHPDVEHMPDDVQHYVLPAVFTVKKGEGFTLKYPGPGVCFVSEGEVEYEDTKNPGSVKISAGGVVHIAEGEVIRWRSASVGKGFVAFWVPVSVKGFESFIVPDTAT